MVLSGVQLNNPITIIWIVWWVYWGFSALYESMGGKTKRVERRQPFLASRFQGALLVIALLLVITNILQQYYPLGVHLLPNSAFATYLGIPIAAFGVGFSIWARRHLGSNWSATVTLKKEQTLIKTGPYAIVRHPIYSGISLGIVGSAIASNAASGIIAIAFIVMFSLLRISDEEKIMHERFGKRYEEYSRQVKAFIPWIW
jgi:protein-S-isoprenylcysteine O-methyltransferase